MNTTAAIRALSALAQETRLAIFRLLVEVGPEGMTVGRIGEALAVVPATLSFHLKELSNAGLIGSRQQGRYVWYSANYDEMSGLIEYLTENCCRGNPDACSVDCSPKKRTAKPRVKILA